MRWSDVRTGYACNQQCRFCDQGDARDRVPDAETAFVEAALTNLPHRDGVVLAGGEITTRPELPGWIQAARKLGFRRVALQTNGYVLSGKGAASYLRDQGLTDVVLALHAPEADVHDWLTATPGSFRRAIAAARACVKAGLRLRLTTVVCRTNVPLLPSMVRIAKELGATSLRFTLCREQGTALPNARMLVPRFDLAGPDVSAALELARSLSVDADVVGLPLCFLGEHRAAAGDRNDVPQPDRAGIAEPQRTAIYLENCTGCRLRSACPGVDAQYAARYGGDELRPVGVPTPPTPDSVELALLVENEPRSTRILRQALVKLRATGAAKLTLVGDHPEIGMVRKEAERLGFELRE